MPFDFLKRKSEPARNYTRIEVTRFHDIETMNYVGGRRIQPGDRDEPGQYYQVIGFALEDIGYGLKEYERLLPSHKRRDDALKAAQALAAASGATFIDLTGGR